MKTKLFWILLGVITMSCSDTDSEPAPDTMEYTPSISETLSAEEAYVMPEIVNAQIDFVKAVILNDKTGNNLAFSPISYQFTMSMIANGVSDEIKHEILTVLGVSDLNALNSINKKVYSLLPQQHANTDYVSASSLWYDRSLSLKRSYLEKIDEYYTLDVFDRDMHDSAIISEMNSWCLTKTNNTITDFFNESPGDFSILNALYFKSPWIEKFDKSDTQLKPFYGENGNTFVQTMSKHVNAHIHFTNPEDAIALKLLCGGKRFSVTFVEAPEKMSINDFIQTETFNKAVNELEPLSVVAYIPKFKLNPDKISLIDVSKYMGIEALFSKPISEIFDEPTHVTHLEQKSAIEINEDGAEASVSTNISGAVYENYPGMEIKINRPFVVLIRDESTGMILFAGKVANI